MYVSDKYLESPIFNEPVIGSVLCIENIKTN